MIFTRLHNYLKKFSILNKYQYGFRKSSSTSHAIYDIYYNQLKSRAAGQLTCSIYEDISKAFDTVDHSILIEKLESYGIRGNVLQLLISYITKRKQYTVINGIASTELEIIFGVPQG